MQNLITIYPGKENKVMRVFILQCSSSEFSFPLPWKSFFYCWNICIFIIHHFYDSIDILTVLLAQFSWLPNILISYISVTHFHYFRSLFSFCLALYIFRTFTSSLSTSTFHTSDLVIYLKHVSTLLTSQLSTNFISPLNKCDTNFKNTTLYMKYYW